MKPIHATDEQRASMRGCLHSQCNTVAGPLPAYTCTQKHGRHRSHICVLYEADKCRHYEVFPERFNT